VTIDLHEFEVRIIVQSHLMSSLMISQCL